MKNKWKNPGNGDIGRRIAIVKENRKLIADLAPKYLGKGMYTTEWFCEVWDAAMFDVESEESFEMFASVSVGDVGENPSARKLNALGNKALADMGLLN